jgi:hypothetical protein
VVRLRILQHGRIQLAQIIHALHLSGVLAGRVERRQQDRDEHRNDANDHQQFDESKTRPRTRRIPMTHTDLPLDLTHIDVDRG